VIDFLEGRLASKSATRVVIECAGVGYEVLVPLTTSAALPAPDSSLRLLTVFHVREEAHVLYGFASDRDREMFRMLTGVSGVGPKTALAALSCLSGHELASAIGRGDVAAIKSIPGVGQKLANRIVAELEDRLGNRPGGASLGTVVGGEAADGSQTLRDAEMALIALGYKPTVAGRIIADVIRANPAMRNDLDALIRAAITP
jgi:Holliday junction DNA helicase RuvA